MFRLCLVGVVVWCFDVFCGCVLGACCLQICCFGVCCGFAFYLTTGVLVEFG